MPRGARYVNKPITLTDTATAYIAEKTREDGTRTHAAHFITLIEAGYNTREQIVEALQEDERYQNLLSFTKSPRTFVSGYLNWLKRMAHVEEEAPDMPEPKVKKPRAKKVKPEATTEEAQTEAA